CARDSPALVEVDINFYSRFHVW
nr:immunoglobulin heavy chain junction region [Macaca mulatta]MOV42196.1 immunoglobulin heavy chain junction region [Macaca mulatta]MOV42797.1 immunoglobulin heavy chain junction region [Macaca mulatta]MOV46098.1 immunoglobulin heavy chain junction region [Macaca mulatta]